MGTTVLELNRRGRTQQSADSVGRSLHALQQGVDHGRPCAEARPVQEHHGAAAHECKGRRRGERVGLRCRARGRCVSPTRSPCFHVPRSRVDATDGSVRDVTPRYSRAFTNVTLKLRVPTSSKARKENGGDDWFAGVIRPFKRGFELVSRPRQGSLDSGACGVYAVRLHRVPAVDYMCLRRIATGRKRRSCGIARRMHRSLRLSEASRIIPSGCFSLDQLASG